MGNCQVEETEDSTGFIENRTAGRAFRFSIRSHQFTRHGTKIRFVLTKCEKLVDRNQFRFTEHTVDRGRNTIDPESVAKDTSGRFRNWNEKVHH
jgi:predicted P-loop ATPase